MSNTIEELNQRTQNLLEELGFENIVSVGNQFREYFIFEYSKWFVGGLSYDIYENGITDIYCEMRMRDQLYIIYAGQKWVELRYKLEEFSKLLDTTKNAKSSKAVYKLMSAYRKRGQIRK